MKKQLLLESINNGETYHNNTGFFNKTPIINIDHKSENEQFGNINLIDITASTTAEIIFSLFKKIKPIWRS